MPATETSNARPWLPIVLLGTGVAGVGLSLGVVGEEAVGCGGNADDAGAPEPTISEPVTVSMPCADGSAGEQGDYRPCNAANGRVATEASLSYDSRFLKLTHGERQAGMPTFVDATPVAENLLLLREGDREIRVKPVGPQTFEVDLGHGPITVALPEGAIAHPVPEDAASQPRDQDQMTKGDAVAALFVAVAMTDTPYHLLAASNEAACQAIVRDEICAKGAAIALHNKNACFAICP